MGGQLVRESSCCKENDYYIKQTGYKYYSVEKCVKVEEKDVPAGFMAYKYTEELNDSLIGKKKNLPYSLCYNGNLLIAHNNNFQKNNTLYISRLSAHRTMVAMKSMMSYASMKNSNIMMKLSLNVK